MIARVVKRLLNWDSKTEEEKYLFKFRLAGAAGRVLSPFPVPLWWLLRLYGCDKQRPGWHNYGPTYGRLFRRWKYRPVRMLEIGIGGYSGSLGGDSLLAWGAFFPFGRIVAGDIVPKLQLTGGPRHVRQLDQSSETDLRKLCRDDGPFDIIIDDGSHFSAHQIFTFEQIFAALKDNGVYVVEDVQTSFWRGEVMGTVWDGAAISDPAFEHSCYSYFLNLAKYINHAEFIDRTNTDENLIALGRQIVRIVFEHNMIVIEKGDNTETSTLAASVSR